MTNEKEAAPIKPKGINANNNSNRNNPTEVVLERKQKLNELQMSWAGKLFFAGVAAWLGGTAYKGVSAGSAPRMPIKIRGSKEQIKAVMDALTSSRAFQDEINKPGATIEGVINKLKIKDLNRQNFEKLTGKKWPL